MRGPAPIDAVDRHDELVQIMAEVPQEPTR